MPTLNQLRLRMPLLLSMAKAFCGVTYRSVTPRYANEADLLTGVGSKRDGGRWNPVGIAVVYNSLTPETAMAETLAHYRYYNIPIEDCMPRTFVATEFRLITVLDLRLGRVRQRLQVSQDRILTVDWRKEVFAGRLPITQAIGQVAAEIGLEGLIVPSAVVPEEANLLVFPDNLQSGSTCTVLNAHHLPKT